MRPLIITPILIAATLAIGLAVAKPAFAQDAAWQRQRAAAVQREQDARRDSLAFQQEQRARDQRARTEATLRSMQSGELAGGPSAAALPTYSPSTIAPMELPRTPTVVPLSADQARMDAIMAEALARSNARVKAATPGGNR